MTRSCFWDFPKNGLKCLIMNFIGYFQFASSRNYLYFQIDIKTRGNIFKESFFHLCAGVDVYVMPVKFTALLRGGHQTLILNPSHCLLLC